MLELFRAHPLAQTWLDNKRIIKYGVLISVQIDLNLTLIEHRKHNTQYIMSSSASNRKSGYY